MQYLSTRGGDDRLSFEQAVLTGLAPNGGLYIPESIPCLPADWQQEWSTLPFTELALRVYSLFISPTEVPTRDLKTLIEKSYSTFRHPDIAPLRQTGEREWVLELFHGPTFAFKDVALQFLGNLFEYFLERKNKGKKEGEEREGLTVVGATSGDTGSAAIYGLRSKKDISIFILHPKGRVSPIQEAQMTTVTDKNVFNLAVEGTFDDCQDIVKALFSDKEFNAAYHLGAINSINWARILAQIVYYFSSYFALVRQQIPQGDTVQYVVPTGNFGDVLAGYYAKRLGLPGAKLGVATNSNDILTRFWKSGIYEKQDSGDRGYPDDEDDDDNLLESSSSSKVVVENATVPVGGSSDGSQGSGVAETLSPAMDILVSSNFERLLFYLALEAHSSSDNSGEQDASVVVRKAQETVEGWMARLKKEGKVVVMKEAVKAARREMVADRASDKETTETIRNYFTRESKFGPYVVDPHTAVGLTVANRLASKNPKTVHQIVLATAHPAKFNAAVSDALSQSSSFNFERDVLPPEFVGLMDRERRVFDVKGDSESVKDVIVREVKKLRGPDGVKDGAQGNAASV